MAKILLEMKNITKTFPGVKALDNVNLQVEEGEIHALVGENGAGKSTLMNVLSGIYPYGTYEGNIIYNGEICKFNTIKDSEEKGIVIIHQELALIPYMTIGENMYLGNERGKSFSINWNETYGEADKYLKIVGLEESSRTLIKDIGVGKQQLVEIAKALAKHAKLLILDEPTASLNEDDSQALLDLLLKFKEQGMTSIIISHKLNEISYVADKITVIRDGSTIETLDKKVDDFSEQRIIQGMVGREMTDRFPKRPDVRVGAVSMEVKNWTVYHPLYSERKVVDNVSFKIHKGEVVGISGLMGAGRTELAMSIFGKSYGTKISGQIFMNGKEVKLNTVQEAIDNKLAYVTEDRKGNGLILSKSIKMNTSLANMKGISNGQVIDADKEYAVAEEYRKKLKTKCPSVEQNVGNLSGGNQQKVLLAKWMFAEPDILILDEPTAVLTPQETEKLFNVLRKMRDDGKAIVIITHKMHEVESLSDRVAVLRNGQYIGSMLTKDTTVTEMTNMMVGHAVTLNIVRPEPVNPKPRIEVQGLTVRNEEGIVKLKDVSFTANSGEILGIAGISGCGQKELLEAIAGLQVTEAGTISYVEDDGSKEMLIGKDPLKIAEMGVSLSFVPEDRLGMGLVGNMDLTDNMMLRSFRQGHTPFTNRKPSKQLATDVVENLEVVTPGITTPVRRLSGGNVQKVLVGREIASAPTVLLTAYVVRGLDINSSYTIYDLINEQKKKGVAVIFVGEDLDVLMELSDRIMVLCGGEVSGILDARKTDKNEVGMLMTRVGGKEHEGKE